MSPVKQTPFMRAFFGLILPVSLLLWVLIIKLTASILMKIFPNPEFLTRAQYITSVTTTCILAAGALLGLIMLVCFVVKFIRES